MRINSINTAPIYNNQNTYAPNINPIKKTNNIPCDTVSFGGKNDVLIKNLYKHMMRAIDEPYGELVTRSMQYTREVPLENQLGVLERLTKYSNLDSIELLKQELLKNNITHFAELTNGKKPILSLNTAFNYLMRNEEKTGGKRGLILDSSTIKYLTNLQYHDPAKFKKILNESQPIFIKDFEESYNIFNQAEPFDRFAMPKIEGAYMFDYHDLEFYLDYDKYMRVEGFDIKPLIIDIPSKNQPSGIVQNLTPRKPTLEEFETEINKISEGFNSESQDFLFDFLANDFHCFTPRILSQKLKLLNKLITQHVQANNREVDNIYYAVPNLKNSFGIINYQYKLINNIPDRNFLLWDGKAQSSEVISKLPEDSTIVILDDAAISGATLFGRTTEQHKCFSYNVEYLDKERPDIKLIFAPVIDTSMSRGHFRGLTHSPLFNHQNRGDKDVLISAEQSIPVHGMGLGDHNPLVRILNPKSQLLEWNSAILFPHNAPDNNAPALRGLIEKFYPSGKYTKTSYTDTHTIYENESPMAKYINSQFYTK